MPATTADHARVWCIFESVLVEPGAHFRRHIAHLGQDVASLLFSFCLDLLLQRGRWGSGDLRRQHRVHSCGAQLALRLGSFADHGRAI